jgi:hypothetical protein
MSGDILDTIDGALHDYAMSADAMRWTPDPPTRAGSQFDLTPEQTEALARAAARSVEITAEAISGFGVALIQAAHKLSGLFANLERRIAEMDPAIRSALCRAHDIPDVWAARERAAERAVDSRAYALATKARRSTGPARPHPGRVAYGRNR